MECKIPIIGIIKLCVKSINFFLYNILKVNEVRRIVSTKGIFGKRVGNVYCRRESIAIAIFKIGFRLFR